MSNSADAYVAGPDGMLPLHAAAALNKVGAIRALVLGGVAIDAKNSEKMTALHIAAEKGNAAAIDLLLNKGAHINEPDKAGRTALAIAVAGGHTQVESVLRARGATLQPDAGTTVVTNRVADNGCCSCM
eukprot:GILJ01028672.1.p2 GENE.GILJ01028672.1~~GILJ01028672.1.p2  ORF type:complete len:129 (+),score=13.89 GILJ01028672.1:666-1052(+)